MLRAVVATNDNPIEHKCDPAELLAHHMFQWGMSQIWPGWYQVVELEYSSPSPPVTEVITAMSPLKQKTSLHDEQTGTITFIGRMFISKDTHDFTCVCTLHNRKLSWQPYLVSLTISGQRHDFMFRTLNGIDFDICKASPPNNEGPQPAHI